MAQIDKNTVQAQNQLRSDDVISYIHPEGSGLRVLFVGNSITRHGVKPDIGWENDWGMAASSAQNDYVHIVAEHILKKSPDACFCVCQAAQWEVNCYNGETVFHLFRAAREFRAELIIMRLAENCPRALYDYNRFQEVYGSLLAYLDPKQTAKVVITTSFWRRPEDEAIRAFARSHEYPMAYLGDLGEDETMKAIGLFEHMGVANHPGDLGMKKIAERIINAITYEMGEQ